MAGGQRPPEFLSTHPNPTKRAKDLSSNMPEAMKFYEQWKKDQLN